MPVPLWEAKAQFFRMLRHPVRIRVLELLLGRRRRSAALLPPRGWSCTFTVPAGVQAMQDTRTAATRWCQEATGQDEVFDQKVAKAVSDLVTGMLRHSPVAHVGLDARAGQLVIAVTDTQQHLPLLHRDPAVPGLRLEPGPAPGNPGHGAVPHGGVTVVMLRFPLPPPAASRQPPGTEQQGRHHERQPKLLAAAAQQTRPERERWIGTHRGGRRPRRSGLYRSA
ncbi:hypothetical protein SUDANB9_06228 [Streptomyces sp. enrichment culture]